MRSRSPQKSAADWVDRATEVPLVDNSPARQVPGLGGDRVTSRPQEPLVAKSAPPVWYGFGQKISARSYLLADPLVYLSDRAPTGEEASCIDLSLEVGKPLWGAAGALGYYPTYAKLTPDQGRQTTCRGWRTAGPAF